jgi:transposase
MRKVQMAKRASSKVADWREGRRIRAYELKQAGWKQKDIAAALGVSNGAVSQWMRRAQGTGAEGLRRHPARGASSKLSAMQLEQLPALLAQGAEAYGFRGNVWTYERIRYVIQQEFGVSYHADHMNFILKKIGWTRQKPRKRAAQRDESAIAEWKADWSQVEKKPQRKGEP